MEEYKGLFIESSLYRCAQKPGVNPIGGNGSVVEIVHSILGVCLGQGEVF